MKGNEMTKFTPPETFPHECLLDGDKCTLLGVDTWGEYAAVLNHPNGTSDAITACAEYLRDLPKVTSTWQNIEAKGYGGLHSTREMADNMASDKRIAVLRRDTVDGVTTCRLEDV